METYRSSPAPGGNSTSGGGLDGNPGKPSENDLHMEAFQRGIPGGSAPDWDQHSFRSRIWGQNPPVLSEEEKIRAFLTQGIPAGLESMDEGSVTLDNLAPEYEACSDHLSDSEG